jgi:hypothetical protein
MHIKPLDALNRSARVASLRFLTTARIWASWAFGVWCERNNDAKTERRSDTLQRRQRDVLAGLDTRDVLHRHIEELGQRLLADFPLASQLGNLLGHTRYKALFSHTDGEARRAA